MAYKEILANFDIDGTIITMWGVHTKAYATTVKELYGIKDFDFRRFYKPGSTQQQAVTDNLLRMGHDIGFINKGLDRVPELMTKYYGKFITPESITILPGVVDLLKRLSAEGILAGVITGNSSSAAALILANSGLDRYFGYVSTPDAGNTRDERMLSAVKKAQAISGIKYAMGSVFYFDDSEHSIAVSRRLGIRSVAVATGETSREALAKEAPDYIMDNLSDTEAVMGILTGPAGAADA
ncbi:MAG TPA: HAD hydrolase-like protein [Candidatus Acidoferrales bacterium]|nr:HAD hydrolase-like protein [Candidatus Acidoferrales bacterium]